MADEVEIYGVGQMGDPVVTLARTYRGSISATPPPPQSLRTFDINESVHVMAAMLLPQVWEYHSCLVPHNGNIVEAMREFGLSGWQAFHVLDLPAGYQKILFRRPAPQPAMGRSGLEEGNVGARVGPPTASEDRGDPHGVGP